MRMCCKYLIPLLIHGIGIPALANVEVAQIGGSGTITNKVLNFVDGAWEITFTAAGESSITVGVQADASEAIRFIRVEPNLASGFSTGTVLLVVRAKPATSGRVTRVEEITFTANDGTANSELFISQMDVFKTTSGTDGNIGAAGISPGGIARAHAINTMTAEGNITANVATVGRLFGGASSITLI